MTTANVTGSSLRQRPKAAMSPIDAVEAWLERLVKWPVAVLVLVEICLLLTNVISRFVLHNPLGWADELAAILFIWLGMLGSVLALQRGEHMQLKILASRLPRRWSERLPTLALMAPALLLVILMPSAIEYAEAEAAIMTPALGWPNVIRAAAVPVGLALMLAVSLLRMLREKAADAVMVAAGLALVAAALWLLSPVLLALGQPSLIVFFVVLLVVGVALGVPIAFVFGLATTAYFLTMTDVPLLVMSSRMDEGMSSLILLAVPLFVFLGVLIEETGMALAIIELLALLLGRVRGGLNYVLLGGMYLVSGISGSKAADMAAIAPVLFPEMKRRGADEGEMISLLSASGAMSETIPPSIVLIAIGSAAGVSIAALFSAGLLPALVLAVALAVVARWRTPKDDRAARTRPGLPLIARTVLVAVPAMLLPVAIRFCVTEGVATATEVSSLGIAYSVIVGCLFYKGIDLRRLPVMLANTAALSGAILFIIGAASGMAWALTTSGFSQQLTAIMSAIPGGAAGFLAVSILVFIILGSILEGIPAIVLFAPLLFPVARSMGIADVHYAMVVVLAMGLGLFSPPFGVGYYSACAIAKVDPDKGLRKIWPYMAAILAGLLLVAAFPWVSLVFVPAR